MDALKVTKIKIATLIASSIFLAVMIVISYAPENKLSNSELEIFLSQTPYSDVLPFYPESIDIVSSELIQGKDGKQAVTFNGNYIITKHNVDSLKEQYKDASTLDKMRIGFEVRTLMSKGEKIADDQIKVSIGRTVFFIENEQGIWEKI